MAAASTIRSDCMKLRGNISAYANYDIQNHKLSRSVW